MLYLESPVGAGFSTPVLNASEYNDVTTTDRVVEFLELFLSQFPAYKNRPFYVTGETYAGMYLVNQLIEFPVSGYKVLSSSCWVCHWQQSIYRSQPIIY